MSFLFVIALKIFSIVSFFHLLHAFNTRGGAYYYYSLVSLSRCRNIIFGQLTTTIKLIVTEAKIPTKY